MSGGSLTLNHGSWLFIILSTHILFLTSSEDCKKKCDENHQNGRCLKDVNGCTLFVCNEGFWGAECQFGRLRLKNKKGYITDGYGSYPAKSKVMWLIETDNSAKASIHFKIEEYTTECNWDYLYIFDGGSIHSPQLAALSGRYLPETNSSHIVIPQEIVAKSGKAYLYFYSDVSVQSMGFNISYSVVENCDCSNNGRCDAAGMCSCDPGWSGSTCDTRVVNCSTCVNGVCNKTSGHCMCHEGYRGKDCRQLVTTSYWTSIDMAGLVPPMASHSTAIIDNWMWVYSGYTSRPVKNQQMFKYHLKEKKWQNVDVNKPYRWGHTMVAHKDKLIVFGGEIDEKITNSLGIFDVKSNTWTDYSGHLKSVGVSGHTATIVGDMMIVIFGLSAHGLFPNVQEYNITGKKWEIIESDTSFVSARHGHTSVYDHSSALIYVYGGTTWSQGKPIRTSPTDSLIAYSPTTRKWSLLPGSNFKQTMHSAVILDGMMLVYGGNPYIHHKEQTKECHSSKLLSYDIACQEWKSLELPQLPKRMSRYGHTAVTKGSTMYVFGGFNGALFNDILTYTHRNCSTIFNKTECLEDYFSAGCHWTNNRCVNRGSLNPLPKCPPKYTEPCSRFKSCDECKSSTSDCTWSGSVCRENNVVKNNTCPDKSIDKCSHYHNCNSCYVAGCLWAESECKQAKSQHITVCPKPCAERLESSTCLDGSPDVRCLWCESLKRCIDDKLYVVFYPYGQCLEWTTKSTAKDTTCISKETCQDCHTLPGCGWCEGPEKTGLGQCWEGSDTGPNKHVVNCNQWHFIGCPPCQCHGHSNCSINSSVCLSCGGHTTGEQCEKCAPGYFGDSKYGGVCKRCDCNGHADTCDSLTGKCICKMRGAEGDHCERCTTSSYVGNATNGGYCYYKLTPEYRYTINVSDKTMFNFISSPTKTDKDTVVTVDIIRKNRTFPAKFNISVGHDNSREVFLLTNILLTSKYEESFSKKAFDFGHHNFHFKIYIYDLTPNSVVSISVHQPIDNSINLLQFFIIFLACFIGLLILAVIFWKVKASYDTFRSTRRRNVELVYMTNRPFASIPICVDKPEDFPMKNKPSPITSEICYGNKAAVVTVLVRMPLCAQAQSGSSAGTLCLGSALVNYNEHHSSKMMTYMKNVKRRRNPFRTSHT